MPWCARADWQISCTGERAWLDSPKFQLSGIITADRRWSIDDQAVHFVWRETGGPAVNGAPELSGFGSRLLRDTVEGQFQGSLSHAWNADGLMVWIAVPLERLAH